MEIDFYYINADQDSNNDSDQHIGRKEEDDTMKYRMEDNKLDNSWRYVFPLLLGLGTVVGVAVGTGNITVSVIAGTGAFALFAGFLDRMSI